MSCDDMPKLIRPEIFSGDLEDDWGDSGGSAPRDVLYGTVLTSVSGYHGPTFITLFESWWMDPSSFLPQFLQMHVFA